MMRTGLLVFALLVQDTNVLLCHRRQLSPLIIDGREVGEMKTVGELSFLRIYNAGHMVPR